MQRRYVRLPPTKYELLIQARGALQRLKIRIKYPLMKQMRPFNLNDITALFSWVFVGHTIWLIAGTTSFISLALWTANSLQFQEWVVRKTGRFLSLSTGTTFSFESATPNWKDGKIRFDRIRISCMPRSEQAKFRLGIQETSPEIIQGDLLAGIELEPDEMKNAKLKRMPWFDLTADTVEFELSMLRWMEGKGVIKTASIKGIRGILDNRRGGWNKHLPWDPELVRKGRIPSHFEMERLSLDDASVTVYMPGGFRAFPISIIQAQFSKFRKQWLLFDIICADYIVGSIDTSIFSIHTPQIEKSVLEHSDLETKQNAPSLANYYPYKKFDPQGVLVGGENKEFGLMTDQDMKNHGYERKSRISMTNLNLDHAHRFGEGPPQWITSGTMDFCADIYAPDKTLQTDPPSIWAAVLETTKSVLPKSVILGLGNGQQITLGEPIRPYKDPNTDKKFIMDVDIRFKDVKGSVPRKIPQFNYLNNTIIRPVVAYINRNKTLVPIKGRIIMHLENMNGAYTLQDSTLSQNLNKCITQGFVDLSKDHQERNRRLKRIGFWSFREIVRNLVVLHDSLKSGTTARGFWSYMGQ
ncbi:hypothetical protein G6F56_007052 [Rhizopus delemar]|uniref:Mitochondrial distribution and morphology protein 31, mitochondrial n=1 Tax=Rhizopus stolonifer TaxID=4846 RepID=A0A367JDZ6_RHIST|nr:hypothetical protein G6F56_007052 [Rhizopus delemar]RCH88146.1 Mitochondrial distribution and morphology protein 31, mitochondrial precursor [Rhizopus stolonifer]